MLLFFNMFLFKSKSLGDITPGDFSSSKDEMKIGQKDHMPLLNPASGEQNKVTMIG